MTARAVSTYVGILDKYASDPKDRLRMALGELELESLGIAFGTQSAVYKNYGTHAGATEMWVSFGTWGGSVNPTTGHAVTDVEHILLGGIEN